MAAPIRSQTKKQGDLNDILEIIRMILNSFKALSTTRAATKIIRFLLSRAIVHF